MNQDPSCWITFWIVTMTMMKWDAVLWCDLVRTTSISEDDRAQQWDPFTLIDQDENRWIVCRPTRKRHVLKEAEFLFGKSANANCEVFPKKSRHLLYPNLSSQMVNFWLQPQRTNILLFMQLPKILDHGLPSQQAKLRYTGGMFLGCNDIIVLPLRSVVGCLRLSYWLSAVFNQNIC